MKKHFNITCVLIIVMLLTSCKAKKKSEIIINVGTDEPILTQTANSTATSQATKTLQPTDTSTATPTKIPVEIQYQGTALPPSNTKITLDNISQLQKVAQWGRGQVSAVAFTPDGSQFVVSSDLGYAVYSMEVLEAPSIWVPFETRITHETIIFSENGKYLKLGLLQEGTVAIVDFANGKLVQNHADEPWEADNMPVISPGEWGTSVVSQDKSIKFVATNPYDEENPNAVNLTQSILNNQTNELICDLSGEIIYYQTPAISYTEGGCDIKLTAACGEGFQPRAYLPFLSAFSADNQYLLVLYQLTDGFYRNPSGFLRIYNAKTGGLKNIIGSDFPKVAAYTLAPDSKTVLIAFSNESIGLWDLASSKFIFTSTDFGNFVRYGALTNDGKFLILQKSNILEILSTQVGNTHAIHESYNFRLSPDNDNLMYVTSNNLTIKAVEIDSGKTVFTLPGHASSILDFEVSPDGNFLASSSTDCTIKLWNVQSGSFLRTLQETVVQSYWGGPPSETNEFENNSRILINKIQFLPQTEQIIGYGSWDVAVNWDLNSGNTNYVLYGSEGEWEEGSEVGNFYCPSAYNVDVENNVVCKHKSIYNLSSGELIGPYQPDENYVYDCSMDDSVINIENLLLTIGYGESDEKICVRDSTTNEVVARVSIYDADIPYISIKDIWVSADETQLFVLNNYNVIDVFKIVE